MKYSSRFFLYAPLALFLLLALGVSVVWWREADALSDRLDALNGHAAVPGATLAFRSKSISGFPFNLDVVFDGLRVTVKTPHGPASWTAGKFALHALTYGREQMIFEATGDQALTWTDLAGKPHAMPFAAGALHASAILGAQGLSRFDLDGIGFVAPALSAARVQLHLRVAPNGGTVDVFAIADGVHLSPALTGLFGPDIVQVKLNAAATPARAFDGPRAGRTDWVRTFETFRAANGMLDVRDLEIAWPRLSAVGKGALSLDAAHAVQGLLDFKVAGIQTLLGAAQRHRVQGGADSGIAAALLARAAKAGNNDAGLLGAVVAFHGGMVSVGDTPATTEEPLY
ncbi:MAG: DUF2125 domain-containing protein [Rhizomicrobium sp.]